jgi:sugar phosphate isomerase/epimerase
MHPLHPTRRQTLAALAGTGLAAFAATTESAAAPSEGTPQPFSYCFNTSTIRGQKLDLVTEVDIAARAGYQGFEPWIGEIDTYVKGGGSLKELAKRITDKGMTVEDAIGFAEWIVDDDTRRKKGLDEARRCMDLVQQLGGKRLAAPPAGARDVPIDLRRAAERYRALLDIGDKMGIVPQVELWGFTTSMNRLGECVQVAIEADHPKACVLVDVYHLYKGGSSWQGLRLLNAVALGVFHFNDYPADLPRDKIVDAQRVYPGDGIAPLKTLVRDLYKIGFRGMLSLELFNPEYYKQDAFEVAKTGLARMKAVVAAAFAG